MIQKIDGSSDCASATAAMAFVFSTRLSEGSRKTALPSKNVNLPI